MNNQSNPNQKSGQQQDQQSSQSQREQQQRQLSTPDLSQVKEHMEIFGSDGARIGTVDKVEGNRIKLTKPDGGASHGDHHHYISAGSIASVEGNKVRLSSAGKAALQQEKDGGRVADKRN